MNERIKQLALQATQEFSPAFDRDKWQDKFAELIIKKCVMIGNYAHDGGEYPGPMIKEYFGVE